MKGIEKSDEDFQSSKTKTGFDIAVNVKVKSSPQTPVQILLPPDERTVEYSIPENRNFAVSYMLRDLDVDFGNLQNKEPIPILDDDLWESHYQLIEKMDTRLKNKLEESRSSKLIEVIRKELMVLLDSVPSIATVIWQISDVLVHCKGCCRCKVRIRPNLPYLLNRIQDLIKYVTVKKKKLSKEDLSPLQIASHYCVGLHKRAFQSTVKSKDQLESFHVHNQIHSPKSKTICIGRSEKVSASVVSDDRPGVQVLLELDSKTTKKRYIQKAEQVRDTLAQRLFPVYWKEDPSEQPFVEILQPKTLSWNQKQALLTKKCCSVAVRFIIIHSRFELLLGLICTPVGSLSNIQFIRGRGYPKLLRIFEKWDDSLLNLVPRAGYNKKLDVKETQTSLLREYHANVPEIEESLRERMQVEKVRELETEVKGLKDLMLEVHKNQMELSKLLLEKGVQSRPVIELTDTQTLEEQKDEVVQRAAQIELPGKCSSLGTLQLMVDDLKRKCSVKNRMILTLLRSLRSNVPQEWWDELEAYVFDEAKSVDGVDPAKVHEFAQQTSLILFRDDKASTMETPSAPFEELSIEEEPKVTSGIPRVDDNLKTNEGEEVKKEFGNFQHEFNFMDTPNTLGMSAFPDAKQEAEVTLRKLESQISLLNIENEMIWLEINHLKEYLKNAKSNAEIKSMVMKPSSKVSIPIGEKARLVKVKTAGSSEGFLDSASHMNDGKSNTSAVVTLLNLEESTDDVMQYPNDIDENQSLPYKSGKKLSLKLVDDQKNPLFTKSERCRLDNDLNNLDETVTSEYVLVPSKQDRDRLKALLETSQGSNLKAQKRSFTEVIRTPYPSGHVLSQQNYKTKTSSCQAGTSSSSGCRKRTTLPEKPSVMELTEKQTQGMVVLMANERELQTIPESPTSPNQSSLDVNQSIQKLKTRVGSLHKNVTILKSRNDKIDKILEKLLEEAMRNSINFGDMEDDINSLKDKLG